MVIEGTAFWEGGPAMDELWQADLGRALARPFGRPPVAPALAATRLGRQRCAGGIMGCPPRGAGGRDLFLGCMWCSCRWCAGLCDLVLEAVRQDTTFTPECGSAGLTAVSASALMTTSSLSKIRLSRRLGCSLPLESQRVPREVGRHACRAATVLV